MASPVSIGCPLSPAIQEQRPKTFSKNAFKPSLLGATAFDVQRVSNNDANVYEIEEEQEQEHEQEQVMETDALQDTDVDTSSTSRIEPTARDTPVAEKLNQYVSEPSAGLNVIEKLTVEDELDAFEFAFENENVEEEGGADGDFSDNMLLKSPEPLAQSSGHKVPRDEKISKDSVRNAIKFLIEMDSDNINLTTKAWMTTIAEHLGVAELPKEWKNSVKSILVEEATSYTQTEAESSPIIDTDVNVNELALTPAKSSAVASLFSDHEDSEGDDEEEMKENERKDVTSPATPPSPPKNKVKKNEELLVQEKLESELSEREAKMLDYIDRDVDEVDSKAEALRKKLQERKKKRMLEKITAFTLQNSKKTKELKMLTRRLVEEGEYDHASRVVKDATNIVMTDEVELSEDDESESESESDGSDEEEGGCIVLSDDDDEVERDNGDSKDERDLTSYNDAAVSMSASEVTKQKESSSSHRHNPFLRTRRSTATTTSEPTKKKWFVEKEKFRRRANEKAIFFQAKEVGCESVEVFDAILNVVEINRARDAATKQEAQHRQQEQLAIEEEARLARERKFREDMFLVQDDDSEGEMDDDAEMKKAVTLETLKNAGRGEYDVDVDAFSSEDEDDEEGGQNEEERLAQALQEEEAMLERLRQQAEADEAAKDREAKAQEEEKEEKLEGDNDNDSDSVRMAKKHTDDCDENLVDSDAEDNADLATTKSRESHKKEKAQKKSKALTYPEMVRLEEQQARQRKKAGGGIWDDEAEEEEEEGGQAGLGDYGFRISKTEQDDEREAMKIRKGDMSHIVNDEDADLGDEEEGRRRRLEAEEKEEKNRMKAILTGLAKGHSGRKEDSLRRNAGGLYGQDDLAQEGIYAKEAEPEVEQTEEGTLLDDEDDERAMADMIVQMTSRVRQQGVEGDDVEDLTDDSEDEDEEGIGGGDEEMTAEERLYVMEQKQLKKKHESETYKRIYDQAVRHRALRREKLKFKSDSASASSVMSANSLPLLSLTTLSPTSHGQRLTLVRAETISYSTSQSHSQSGYQLDSSSLSRSNNLQCSTSRATESGSKEKDKARSDLKRRTSLPPKKVESGGNTRPRAPKRNRSHGSIGDINSSRGAAALMSGVLDKTQLNAGYGMGMCVSTERRQALLDSNSRTGSRSMAPPVQGSVTGTGPSSGQQGSGSGTISSSNSLFAAVIGGDKSAGGLTRSFSGVLARSKSMTTLTAGGRSAGAVGGRGLVTVASKQFVFKDESQHMEGTTEGDASHSGWGGESSRHGEDSRAGMKRSGSSGDRETGGGGGMKRRKTVGGGGDHMSQKSSLYSKLKSSVGPIRASTSLTGSNSSSQRIRPSAAMRSKLASISNTPLVMR